MWQERYILGGMSPRFKWAVAADRLPVFAFAEQLGIMRCCCGEPEFEGGWWLQRSEAPDLHGLGRRYAPPPATLQAGGLLI